MKRVMIISGLALLAGCATPGSTLRVVGATPASVVIEYTHSYGSELNEAMAKAQGHCAYYGANARMGHTQLSGTNPLDRSIVTFDCVK